jgi:hypothetical protein
VRPFHRLLVRKMVENTKREIELLKHDTIIVGGGMNERNTQPLESVVREMAREFGPTLDGLEWDEQGIRKVAAWLAARVEVKGGSVRL